MPKLSVIAPMYNEQAVIADFIEQTCAVLDEKIADYELLLVDDGSKDLTVAIADSLAKTNAKIKILSFSRNYGHEMASTAGIEHCTGDFAVLMDSDLQHPPEVIPALLKKAQEGFDVVHAKRTDRESDSWLKRKASSIFYRMARRMTGFELDSNAGNFRILSRKVIESLKQMKETNRHLLMLFAYIGYNSASIPFKCQARAAGTSKYGYRKLINLAIDSIISFSHRPLRYMSIISILISLLLTFYAGFILLQRLFYQPQLADGIASVIFITSGLFAVLFFFLAIISEYISRILVETKDRPLYYIKQIIQYDSDAR